MPATASLRRARNVLIAVVVALAAWLLAPAAVAHDVLIDSSPVDGEVLTESPAQVVLTFNNPPLDVGSAIIVEDEAGEAVAEVEGVVEGTEVRAELGEPLTNGMYTVAWRVASSDGHPIEGRIPFTVEVAEEAIPEPTTEDAVAPTAEPTTEATTDAAPISDEATTDEPAEDASGGLPTWATVLIAIAAVGAVGALIVIAVRRQRGAGDPPAQV